MLSGNTLKCIRGIPLFFCEENHIWRKKTRKICAEASSNHRSRYPRRGEKAGNRAAEAKMGDSPAVFQGIP